MEELLKVRRQGALARELSRFSLEILNLEEEEASMAGKSELQWLSGQVTSLLTAVKFAFKREKEKKISKKLPDMSSTPDQPTATRAEGSRQPRTPFSRVGRKGRGGGKDVIQFLMKSVKRQGCKNCFISHTHPKFCNKRKVKEVNPTFQETVLTEEERLWIFIRIKELESRQEDKDMGRSREGGQASRVRSMSCVRSGCTLATRCGDGQEMRERGESKKTDEGDCADCSEDCTDCKDELVHVCGEPLPRRRGGAADTTGIPVEARLENLQLAVEAMTRSAVEVAAYPDHAISVRHVIPNLASGNCAPESVTDQLNNTRNCDSNRDFADYGAGRFPGPDDLRAAVVVDLLSNETAQARVGYLGKDERWAAELQQLRQPGEWDTDLGDLFVLGIAFTTKKNILIYHTSPNIATVGNHPIQVST